MSHPAGCYARQAPCDIHIPSIASLRVPGGAEKNDSAPSMLNQMIYQHSSAVFVFDRNHRDIHPGGRGFVHKHQWEIDFVQTADFFFI